jgi:hypothetical protein
MSHPDAALLAPGELLVGVYQGPPASLNFETRAGLLYGGLRSISSRQSPQIYD